MTQLICGTSEVLDEDAIHFRSLTHFCCGNKLHNTYYVVSIILHQSNIEI
jgi:hypothetical protein